MRARDDKPPDINPEPDNAAGVTIDIASRGLFSQSEKVGNMIWAGAGASFALDNTAPSLMSSSLSAVWACLMVDFASRKVFTPLSTVLPIDPKISAALFRDGLSKIDPIEFPVLTLGAEVGVTVTFV